MVLDLQLRWLNTLNQNRETQADSTLPDSFQRAFIELTLANVRRLPFMTFSLFLCVAALAYNNIHVVWVFTWLSATGFFLFFRAYMINRIEKVEHLNDNQKIDYIAIMNLVNGVVFATSALFFPYLSEFEQTTYLLIVSTLISGVAVSNVGFRKVAMPYISVVLLALVTVILLHANSELSRDHALVLSLLCILILFGANFISKNIFKLYKENIDRRQQFSEMNQMLEKALTESESSSAAKTRFLATASHDLRQPVHTLSLLTAALISRDLDDRTKEISETMNQSLQSLARQLDALLDISKLDAGIVTPQYSNVNVSHSLQKMVEQLRPNAEEKGLSIHANCKTSAVTVSDPTLFERICRNLLSNAIKYTHEGSITVSVEHDIDEIVISFKDTGTGIPEKEQELVFEEFYQMDNPHRDKTKGLGLGLSIVRRLTRLLDMKIELKSKEGAGTEFILRMPKSNSLLSTKEDKTNLDINLSDTQVLVIDDEINILKAMEIYLQGEGCHVVCAEDGKEAMEAIKSQKPDIVIADFRLKHNESGIQVVRNIRKEIPNIPAIIITGDTAPDRLKEATIADAQLLHKPIDVEELKTVMKAALQ